MDEQQSSDLQTQFPWEFVTTWGIIAITCLASRYSYSTSDSWDLVLKFSSHVGQTTGMGLRLHVGGPHSTLECLSSSSDDVYGSSILVSVNPGEVGRRQQVMGQGPGSLPCKMSV